MNNFALIFTDESGAWNNIDNKYYVRSWAKIYVSDFLKLKKDLKENKKLNIIDLIHENKIPIQYFFTFSDLGEFYNRRLKIRDAISLQVLEIFEKFENQLKDYMRKIPIKVADSINYVLFLNIYEKYHILNAIDYLDICLGKDILIFEKPQFNERDYLSLLKELGLDKENVRLLSKNQLKKNNFFKPGVNLCHCLVNNFYNLIMKKGINEKDNNFVSNLISNGNVAKGINKVFLNNISEEITWKEFFNKKF